MVLSSDIAEGLWSAVILSVLMLGAENRKCRLFLDPRLGSGVGGLVLLLVGIRIGSGSRLPSFEVEEARHVGANLSTYCEHRWGFVACAGGIDAAITGGGDCLAR